MIKQTLITTAAIIGMTVSAYATDVTSSVTGTVTTGVTGYTLTHHYIRGGEIVEGLAATYRFYRDETWVIESRDGTFTTDLASLTNRGEYVYDYDSGEYIDYDTWLAESTDETPYDDDDLEDARQEGADSRDEEVADLEADVSNLETLLTASERDLQTAQATLAAALATNTANGKEIATLKGNISTLEDEIKTLKAKIKDLEDNPITITEEIEVEVEKIVERVKEVTVEVEVIVTREPTAEEIAAAAAAEARRMYIQAQIDLQRDVESALGGPELVADFGEYRVFILPQAGGIGVAKSYTVNDYFVVTPRGIVFGLGKDFKGLGVDADIAVALGNFAVGVNTGTYYTAVRDGVNVNGDGDATAFVEYTFGEGKTTGFVRVDHTGTVTGGVTYKF